MHYILHLLRMISARKFSLADIMLGGIDMRLRIIFTTVTFGLMTDVLLTRSMSSQDKPGSRADFLTFFLPALNLGMEEAITALSYIREFATRQEPQQIPLQDASSNRSIAVETSSTPLQT